MAVDSTGLRQDLEQRAAAAFDIACNLLLFDLKGDAPVDTGELRDSGQVEQSGGFPSFTATLTFPVPQASFTNDGTKAHGPVSADFLRFEIGGRVIYTKWVEGVTATHWFDEGVTDVTWERALADAWSQTV